MNREQFLLLKLSEECAEVSQRAIKQIQFGAKETQGKGSPSNDIRPETLLTNAERLRGEILDLFSLISLLEDCGAIPEFNFEDFQDAKSAKIAKMNKYLKYSNELGVIPEGFTV